MSEQTEQYFAGDVVAVGTGKTEGEASFALVNNLLEKLSQKEEELKQVRTERDRFREALESMAHQYANDTTYEGQPALWTGGMSALEEAFEVLGWHDPYPVPERGCQYSGGCGVIATCGLPTPTEYLFLCFEHCQEVKKALSTAQVPTEGQEGSKEG